MRRLRNKSAIMPYCDKINMGVENGKEAKLYREGVSAFLNSL